MGGRAAELLHALACSCQGNSFSLVTEEQAAAFCIPAIAGQVKTDGLLVVGESGRADASVRLFEKDGTESDLCGNGILCVAHHLTQERHAREWKIEMGGRVCQAAVRRSRVTAGFTRLLDPSPYLGPAAQFEQACECLLRLRHGEDTLYFVNSGEPHLFRLFPDPARLDMRGYEALLSDRAIFPRGVNFNIMTARPPFRIRTFERGVNAFTGSCGTASIAAAQLLVLLGDSARSEFSFYSEGGVHEVALAENRVYLTGRVKAEKSCVLIPAGRLTSGNSKSPAVRPIR